VSADVSHLPRRRRQICRANTRDPQGFVTHARGVAHT
jgi:hypothetical protein